SAFYHDSAAALVIGGDLIAAAQEERFTRVKHDPSFPRLHSNPQQMDNFDMLRQLYTLLEGNVFYGDRLKDRKFVTILSPGQFISTNLKENDQNDQYNVWELCNKVLDTTFTKIPAFNYKRTVLRNCSIRRIAREAAVRR